LDSDFCSRLCRAKEAKSNNQLKSATSAIIFPNLNLKKEKSFFRSKSASSFMIVDNPHRRLSVCLVKSQDITETWSSRTIKESIMKNKDTI
jgi:hypothetical protein